ncbi:MAG: DUF4139 domain-containing protein [Sphingomonadales bacterium]
MHAKALTAALLVSAACSGSALAADTTISLDDRKSLSLTVYSGDMALVRDTRTVSVDAGRNVLSFVDVAAQIQAETALIKGAPFDVIEQNFDFDLLSPDKLLEKAVGRTVKLYRTNPSTGAETVEDAVVLGASGGVVLKVADRIEVMQGLSTPNTRLVFDSLPPNLRSRPTLSMTVDAARADSRDLMLTYLTGGLGWKADYVANLSPDEKSLSLQGWITLTNTSGTAYKDARLQVVAGEVNQVRNQMMRGKREYAAAPVAVTAMSDSSITPESFFAYQLYTIPVPVTLAENQTKQISMLEAPRVAATRVLESFDGGGWIWSEMNGEPAPDHPAVTLKFQNRDQDGLGKPLPGGAVRVYKEDARGQTQYVGANTIQHTPKNEKVDLPLGEDFDVTVRRIQKSFQLEQETHPTRKLRDGQPVMINVSTSTWEMQVKNGKKEPVEVRLINQISDDWKITEENLPHVKETASRAVWTVKVPAEGETTVRYSMVVRQR